jgi:general secretion pathway protein G
MRLSRLSRSSVALAARSRKGMSLVEIMVVIAIIGVLMTVVAVNVVGFLDDANVSATKIQIKKMQEALTVYASKHRGKFPSTSEGLAAAKKYFPDNEVPVDAWGNTFLYFSPGTHGGNDYEIISLGKDGKEGGDDANADIQSWNMSDE